MPRAPRDHGRVSAATLLVVCLVTVGVTGQRLSAASGMDGRISGRVLSSSSEPIAGATVALVLLPRTGDAIASWTTTTAGDGTYRFEQLAEGRYAVTANKPGYADAIPSLLSVGSANQRVDLQRDGEASEINLTLQRPGSISGRVFAAGGTPVAGVLVMMQMRGESGHSVWRRSLGRTDAEGRYRARGSAAILALERIVTDVRITDT